MKPSERRKGYRLARRIAFLALLDRGLDRLTIQAALRISRSEYYRLLKRGRKAA